MSAFFKSSGTNTVAVNYTDVSSTERQIPGKGGVVRVINVGTGPVAFNVGETGIGAAVLPVHGTPAGTDTYVIAAGVTELFSLPIDAYVRAIAPTAGTGTLYFSRGEGI